jgi:hypothetical protein
MKRDGGISLLSLGFSHVPDSTRWISGSQRSPDFLRVQTEAQSAAEEVAPGPWLRMPPQGHNQAVAVAGAAGSGPGIERVVW